MSTGLPWTARSSATIFASLAVSSSATGVKMALQFGVVVLRGEGLGPVEGEVEVRAAVVDGAELAAGRLVVLEELAVRGVERVGEDLGLRQLEGLARCSKDGGEGEEFAEAVPAEEVFLE